MKNYYYQVSVLTKCLNPQGLLGIEYYQCESLRVVGCLKSLLEQRYPDAKFRVYKCFVLSLQDLKDDKIPQPIVNTVHEGF